MRSITRQTVTIVLVAQLVWAAILSLLVLAHEHTVRFRALDETIQGRTDSLAGAIQDAEDPPANVYVDPDEFRPPPEDRYVVYGTAGEILGQSSPAPADLLARKSPGFRDVRLPHMPYRVLQRSAMRIIDRNETNGVGLRRPVVIVYATPESHLLYEVHEAVRFYLFAILVSTGLVAASITVLLRRALRPVTDLTAAAARIEAPDLQFQPPPSAMSVHELAPLAVTLDQVARSLREAFAKEQRFLSDAAHELKTAVAVVRSSIQVLLLRPRSAQEYTEGLAQVLDDNIRLETVITDMLQISEVAETSSPDRDVIDLSAVARDCIARARSMAALAGVALQGFADSPVLVSLSPTRAEILLTNLTANAIQHSTPGMTVTISVNHEGTAAVLRVRDTGEGISAEALPRVFERFFRQDASRSRKTGGTGLGLAICKSIVDAAGGTISLSSRVGQGTEATVTFMQP